jgi:PKD repeat protein
VTFNDLTQAVEPVTNWAWDFGDNTSSSDQNPGHSYSQTGHYGISMIVSNGSDQDTIIKDHYISVTDSFDIAFDISQIFSSEVYSIRATDLDRDNNSDLVYTGILSPYMSIAYGSGDSEFGDIDYILTDCDDFTFAYFDADTLIDILAVGLDELAIILNRGNRSFDVYTYPHDGGTDIQSIATGYFNNDAFADIAVTANTVYYGNGEGGFLSSSTLSTEFQTVNISDFDNDGYDDLVISKLHDGTDSAYIYLSDGNNDFNKASGISIGNVSYSISTANSIADFNRDGHSDFALIVPSYGPHEESMMFVGFGDGTGGIMTVDTMRVFGVAYNMLVSDVNRDNNLDLVAVNGSAGSLDIFVGDDLGKFNDLVIIDLGTDHITYSAAAGDFDRDGNPDFATGPLLSEDNLILAINRFPDAPILADEMRTTGYKSVSISVHNPESFTISRNFTTVSGAAFWRLDQDGDNELDEIVMDYNLQYGEYVIVITTRPNASPDAMFNAGIRIDGSLNLVFFYDYSAPITKRGPNGFSSDSIVFHFTVEAESSIQPENGRPTGNTQPNFEWSGLYEGKQLPDSYHFQLDRYHDFRSPQLIYDTSGLELPTFTPPAPLGTDSVFYWRVRAYEYGMWSDYSRTFAAYIIPFVEGDANGDSEINIGDAVYLISYIFKGGPAPDPNEAGDANCDGQVNIGDAVYLIAYIFRGGPPPGCP